MTYLRLAAAAAAAVVVLASPALAQDKVPFTAERSWQIQRLGGPTVSPDGTKIVAPVTTYDMKEDKGLTDLWLWSADGTVQRPLTTAKAGDSSPVFSPDGSAVAFVSKRGDDKVPQLYVLPLGGGEAVRVTSLPTGVSVPKWFPDGKRLAFVSRVWPDLDSWEKQGERLKEREEDKTSAMVWDNGPIRFWDTWIDDRQMHVFAVGVDGGDPVNLTLGTGLELPRSSATQPGPGLYDLSPDGTELAFVADSDPAINETNTDVFTVAIGGKDAVNRTPANAASDGSPSYSPDGRWLAFGQKRIKGFYGDITRLMLLDRRSGAVREVTGEAWDRSADGLVWAPDSKRLYGSIDDAGTNRVYEIPLEGKPKAITGQRHAGRPAPVLRRAADTGAHRPEEEGGREAQHGQRRVAGRHRLRHLRERHLRGRQRRPDPDVGELPAGLRQVEEVPAVPADPRRPAQRHHQCHAVPLERAGVQQLGLRHRLAELPRLVGLR